MNFDEIQWPIVASVIGTVVLILQIGGIWVYYNHIKEFEKNQNVFVSTQLELLKQKFDSHFILVEQQFNDMLTQQNIYVNEIKKSFTGLVESQQIEYNRFIQQQSINFTTYENKIEKTNTVLNGLIDRLNKSLEGSKRAELELSSMNKRLLAISDKMIELQADHERLIIKHESNFENMLEQLRNRSREKLTELIATGELEFERRRQECVQSLDSISDKTYKTIESLMSNESVQYFRKDVSEMNRRFDQELGKINTQLDGIQREALYFKQMYEAEKSKKFWKRIFNS